MQGKEQDLFTPSDKLYGFLRKIKIWKAKFENSDLEIFPLTADTDPEITSRLILEHLSVLEDKLQQYFPSFNVNEYDWVRNPFAVTTADTKHLSLKEAEELAELQADRTIQLKFRKITLIKLWNLAKKKEFSVLSEDPQLHYCTFPQPTYASRDFPDWPTLKIKNGSDFFLLIKNS
jgi:hypothetical protein